MFWGCSPAVDLVDELEHREGSSTELCILVLGGADARHLLLTVSRLYRHPDVRVHFLVQEPCLEPLARQLLLLDIALQPLHALRINTKTRFFMEIYGNTLLRPAVSKFLSTRAQHLLRMLTGDRDACPHLSHISLHKLKYKDRDYLEGVLQTWASDGQHLDMVQVWDRRVRRHLGTRYDSKMGAFDWDLHMHLHDAGATQITPQEYKHWRDTGVAFTWIHSETSKGNRSLLVGAHPHCAYLGDILVGPHVSYGLDSDDKELLKKRNGVNAHTATEVTEHNLRELFLALDEAAAAAEGERRWRVTLLGPGAALGEYVGRCCAVWCGRGALGLLERPEALRCLSPPPALLLLEGCCLDPSCRKPERRRFQEHVQMLAQRCQDLLQLEACCQPFDASKDHMACILLNSHTSQ